MNLILFLKFDINCVVASAVGEPLTTANPTNIPRQHNRPCTFKGESSLIIHYQFMCKRSLSISGVHFILTHSLFSFVHVYLGHPGKGREMVNSLYRCQQSGSRNGKRKKCELHIVFEIYKITKLNNWL